MGVGRNGMGWVLVMKVWGMAGVSPTGILPGGS